jgi:hypothetical protein
MKILSLIITILCLVCCLSLPQSVAQPTEQTRAPLTVEQAEPLAMRLANKKFEDTYTWYKGYQGGIFRTNTPIYNPSIGKMGIDASTYTQVTTNFADGHWIFQFNRRTSHDTCLARVELASDGSTNLVNVERHGGLP